MQQDNATTESGEAGGLVGRINEGIISKYHATVSTTGNESEGIVDGLVG